MVRVSGTSALLHLVLVLVSTSTGCCLQGSRAGEHLGRQSWLKRSLAAGDDSADAAQGDQSNRTHQAAAAVLASKARNADVMTDNASGNRKFIAGTIIPITTTSSSSTSTTARSSSITDSNSSSSTAPVAQPEQAYSPSPSASGDSSTSPSEPSPIPSSFTQPSTSTSSPSTPPPQQPVPPMTAAASSNISITQESKSKPSTKLSASTSTSSPANPPPQLPLPPPQQPVPSPALTARSNTSTAVEAPTKPTQRSDASTSNLPMPPPPQQPVPAPPPTATTNTTSRVETPPPPAPSPSPQPDANSDVDIADMAASLIIPQTFNALTSELATEAPPVRIVPFQPTAAKASSISTSSSSSTSSSNITAASAVVAQSVLAPDPVYVDNGVLRVGFDKASGACINYFAYYTAGSLSENLISTWDSGRFMQQSYYGREDGSKWAWRPWRYNPVQGGSWHTGDYSLSLEERNSYRARANETNKVAPDRFLSTTWPRHWATGEWLETHMIMQQDVGFKTLGGQALHSFRAAFRMIYYGPLVHFSRPQEVPALFLHRMFTRLAYYDGPSPWTGAAPRVVAPHRFDGFTPAPLITVTEPWAAYLLPTNDFGVGIYFPHARQFTAYRVDGDPAVNQADGTAYIAPVIQLGMRPGRRGVQFKYQYAAYVTVGNYQDIVRAFRELKGAAP